MGSRKGGEGEWGVRIGGEGECMGSRIGGEG